MVSFPKESHFSRKSISASFSAHKSNLLMPQVHCPARPIPPAPAHSTLPCIHPLSLCPSCLLLITAHHRCECPYGCRVGHKGVAAGKVSILMHCDLQPSPWCCVQRAPRDRLSANIHAQDGGGGSPPCAAASLPGLGSLSSGSGTPSHQGRGLRLPPLQWSKETSGQPRVVLVPDGGEAGSCNKLCGFLLPLYSP